MFKFLLPLLVLTLSAPGLAKETLTVYTPSSFASEWGPGPAIKQAFEKECNCNVTILGVSDGAAMLSRLRMEGKNSPADVVLGLDNNLVATAVASGLFAKHQQDTTALTVPNDWQNPYFIPYDYGYFAFIYNKEKIANPPESLSELLDSQEKWSVVYQDPRTSTPGLGLLMWMKSVYGEKSDEAWKKLAKKTKTVTKGWSEAYNLFLKGETDFVLSYTTSPAYHIIDEKDTRYAAAMFKEGHYLQIELAGKLANSQHPELADQFMRFVTTKTFQQETAMKNWMYPVIALDLPQGFADLPKPAKSLEFSAQEIEKNRTQWVRQWQSAVVF